VLKRQCKEAKDAGSPKYKELKRGEDPVQRVLYEHSLTYQGLSYNKQD